MARHPRASEGGVCYHVVNRGNDRATVFYEASDYLAFINLIGAACQRLVIRVLAYCLMPNHFHLVLWPFADGDLSRWMAWLETTHARRYRRYHGGWGHIWGGRFKSFPVQGDGHLLRVVRYVERNPVTAGLRRNAQQWLWSSARWRWRPQGAPSWLSPIPDGLPRQWLKLVNEPLSRKEYERYLVSLRRQRPFGDPDWTEATARRLGLDMTLRAPGRPRAA